MAQLPSPVRAFLGRVWIRYAPQRLPLRVFCPDPPIFILPLWSVHGLHRNVLQLRESLAGKRALFLGYPCWDFSSDYVKDLFSKEYRQLTDRCPEHQTTILAASEEDARSMQGLGIRSICCNHNAFVDDRVFCPIPAESKQFDAIYDAQALPYKRHDLAKDIPSLALITYAKPGRDPLQYAHMIKRIIPQAVWANFPDSEGSSWMRPEEVNIWLNRSRVGLCLSASEGAMFASIQYLLAGLPVVSTPSTGGRDTFFTEINSRIADPESRSIAKAVQDLASHPTDPQAIRASVLPRIEEHRANLKAEVDGFLQECQSKFTFDGLWAERFFHCFQTGERSVAEIITLLKHGTVDRP